MNKRKAYIETWGCQLNYHRSERIAGHLSNHGYELIEDPPDADLIVFNTCAVRGKSEEKVRGRIGQIKQERKEDSLLGVGGCMAQHLGGNLFQVADGVDFVFGTSNLSEIPSLADRARSDSRVFSTPAPSGFENLPVLRKSDFFAWITIAEGCSNACAYCIVPQVRGPLRSRPARQVVQEARKLAEDEYKEIQLLGQNVNAYGKDLDSDQDNFAQLLRKVAETRIPRVSFTTPHPNDLEKATLKVMNEYPNITRHLHLPLQSGSTQVLKIMKRNYSREDYLGMVEKARKIDPDLNITTDIIVGHPGETKEDFRKTLDVIERVRFGSIYAARFSPRPNTGSAEMKDEISEEEKKRRLNLVLEKQKECTQEYDSGFIGRQVQVLVEGVSRKDEQVYGKNEFGRTITFEGEDNMIGEFKKVILTSATQGKLVKKRQKEGIE